jgi:DNA-binding MarR family transcriptional regulator
MVGDGKTMPLSMSEYEMLAAFRYRLRQFLHFSEQAAGSVGLTQQQYQALLAVRAHPGPELLTISELASQLLIKHHSAVGMVDRLAEQGLLQREPSRQDARKVGLRLTPAGARAFHKLASIHRAELRRIGPDLGRFMEYFARAAGERPARKRATAAGRRPRS